MTKVSNPNADLSELSQRTHPPHSHFQRGQSFALGLTLTGSLLGGSTSLHACRSAVFSAGAVADTGPGRSFFGADGGALAHLGQLVSNGPSAYPHFVQDMEHFLSLSQTVVRPEPAIPLLAGPLLPAGGEPVGSVALPCGACSLDRRQVSPGCTPSEGGASSSECALTTWV